MTKLQAVKFFGSVKNLADALGVWPQTVFAWNKKIPIPRQYQIATISNGKLKVDTK